MRFIFFFLVPLLFVLSCSRNTPFNPENDIEEVWTTSFDGYGIYSSPRASDINGDGVKDLIFGVGRVELQDTDIGYTALDGTNGDVLWTLPARDQIFGSANFIDLTNSGTDDIIIGGRAAELVAINGSTGEIIWEYLPDVTFEEAKELGLYNFYNPQFVPDQDGDGIDDIVIANGGDYTLAPTDRNRPVGYLMVISSATGELLTSAEMPDGKEIYMSIVAEKFHPEEEDVSIIYGTGGETIEGNLFRTTLSELLTGDLSNSKVLYSNENKGFIAPPVLVDLNQDGYLDVVVNSVEGKMIAISGYDNSILWETDIENTEAYASISPGNFTSKNRIDLFTTYSIGVWPSLMDNVQILINGNTGEVLETDSLGVYQTASPVVADINNNGYHEAIMNINIPRQRFEGGVKYEHLLAVYDFHNSTEYSLTSPQAGANLAPTPWVGDLDNDGQLDFVYALLTDENNIFSMNGFQIVRLQSRIKTDSKVSWGAYMGSNYDGVYQPIE